MSIPAKFKHRHFAPELSVQQRVWVALGIDRMLDSSEPTVLVAHTLHFGANSIKLVVYMPNRLLTRSPHLIRELGNPVVPTLGHSVELTAHLCLGAAVTHPVGALQRTQSGLAHGFGSPSATGALSPIVASHSRPTLGCHESRDECPGCCFNTPLGALVCLGILLLLLATRACQVTSV